MDHVKSNYLRKILIIAVPIMLSNVISQLQMIIDRIFLGQMDTMYMSALGNVNSPMWTTMSFCFSIIMGASILISQNVGAGNKEDVELYAASMIKWSNVIPFLLFIFWMFFGEIVFKAMGVSENVMPYCITYSRYCAPIFLILGFETSFSVIMQTSSYTKPLVLYGIIRSGVNIVLDWIMIFGRLGFPEMGIKGAAIATTIAEYAGCIFAAAVVFKVNLATKPSIKNIINAKIAPFFKSIKLGINVALEDFAWNFGNIMLIRMLNSINELAAAIYSIVFSVEVLAVVMISSIGNATMTLSGEARGRKDQKQFVWVCVIAYILSALSSTALLVVCIFFPEAILAMFTKDTAIITGCGIYLFLVCINLYGKSANIIIGNGIRGSGDTKWMFYTQIFGTIFVIACAATFVYVFNFGMAGVFVAIICDELVRAVINFVRIFVIIKNWDK